MTLQPTDLKIFIPSAPDSDLTLDLMDSVLVNRAVGGVPSYTWVKLAKKAVYGPKSTLELGTLALGNSLLPFRQMNGALAKDIAFIPDIQPISTDPSASQVPGHTYAQFSYGGKTPGESGFSTLPANHGHIVRAGGKNYYLSYRVMFVANTHPTDTLHGLSLSMVTCPLDSAFVLGLPSLRQAYSDAAPYQPSDLFVRAPRSTGDFAALRGDLPFSFSVPDNGLRTLLAHFGGGLNATSAGLAQTVADGNYQLLGEQLVGTLFEAGGVSALDGVAFAQRVDSAGNDQGLLSLAPGEYAPFLILALTPEDVRTSLDNSYTLAIFGVDN